MICVPRSSPPTVSPSRLRSLFCYLLKPVSSRLHLTTEVITGLCLEHFGVTNGSRKRAKKGCLISHLMQQGIEIYEYQPAMMHTKAVVVDNIISVVGSANFDNRSFAHNEESNVCAYDRALAQARVLYGAVVRVQSLASARAEVQQRARPARRRVSHPVAWIDDGPEPLALPKPRLDREE